jgi:hypothetical protein
MEKKHIVINGFSADAIAVLVNSFNSLSKRGILISTKHISTAERRAGSAYINDSAYALLGDILKIIGPVSWGVGVVVDFNEAVPLEKRIWANPEILVMKYGYKQKRDMYEEALSDICSKFNAKMRTYKLKFYLEYTETK